MSDLTCDVYSLVAASRETSSILYVMTNKKATIGDIKKSCGIISYHLFGDAKPECISGYRYLVVQYANAILADTRCKAYNAYLADMLKDYKAKSEES